MAILTGPEIERRVKEKDGSIVIEPFDPECAGANSYDVHLGDELRVYESDQWLSDPDRYIQRFIGHKPIDPRDPPTTRPLGQTWIRGQLCWTLTPGTVYLASTREYTETRGLVPVLYGRSSIGRLGLFIHVTAGYGDDGFCGHWTLELVATQPVIVRPGDRIGQIVYHTLEGNPKTYRGRYQNQPAEPVASRYHLGQQHGGQDQ